MKTVKGILESKGREVHTILPDATVLQALEAMAKQDIGSLVVTDRGRIVGLISERDYARKVILKGKFSKDTPVRDVMNDHAICVSSQHTVEACMALMTSHRARHLPVVDDGELCGIVSIGDVVRAIIEDQQFTIDQLAHYITGTT